MWLQGRNVVPLLVKLTASDSQRVIDQPVEWLSCWMAYLVASLHNSLAIILEIRPHALKSHGACILQKLMVNQKNALIQSGFF